MKWLQNCYIMRKSCKKLPGIRVIVQKARLYKDEIFFIVDCKIHVIGV